MNPIRIGNDRELFWDDYLVDTAQTNAYLKQHSPVAREIVRSFEEPWEGDSGSFYHIVKMEEGYRMYYIIRNMFTDDGKDLEKHKMRINCLESKDGIHWTAPQLNIRPFDEHKTNTLLDGSDAFTFDNFYVFIDENPDCPPEEKFKATSRIDRSGYLWCWVSADGIHWKKGWAMTNRGTFDTLNVAFWSPEHNKYFCFIRGFHDMFGPNEWDGLRDVRVITSDDFHNWSDPEMLDFGSSSEDYEMYTNAIHRYPRAPHMMIGFPSRYIERMEWTPNYDQLPDPEGRKDRMKILPRLGLAMTDCVIMTSRDGYHWKRGDEAWVDPGIEASYNWQYGNCYPSVGLIETPSDIPGAPNEYSLYMGEGPWGKQPMYLRRYTIRMDGFRSYRADNAPCTLTTKPILYEGGNLHLNFSTSAKGYIYVTMRSREERTTFREIRSCEIFGNSLDRAVSFDGDMEQFLGKEVVLEFKMSDADLYAMQFTD